MTHPQGDSDKVTVEVRDRIMRLTLNRAKKKNALSRDMYAALAGALEQAAEDTEVRVVLLAGEGDAFCAGNDVADFLQEPSFDESSPVVRFLRVLARSAKPLVAAVNGHAVGIGVTMLLHCDLAYASSTARFRLPFVNLGLCPEAASSLLLPHLIGRRRAAELLLLGEEFSAEQACQFGIVNAVLPPENLLEVTLSNAEKLAAQPPEAVRVSRELLRRPLQQAIDEAIEEEGRAFAGRLQSPETLEALLRFMNRG